MIDIFSLILFLYIYKTLLSLLMYIRLMYVCCLFENKESSYVINIIMSCGQHHGSCNCTVKLKDLTYSTLGGHWPVLAPNTYKKFSTF